MSSRSVRPSTLQSDHGVGVEDATVAGDGRPRALVVELLRQLVRAQRLAGSRVDVRGRDAVAVGRDDAPHLVGGTVRGGRRAAPSTMAAS